MTISRTLGSTLAAGTLALAAPGVIGGTASAGSPGCYADAEGTGTTDRC